MRKEMKLVKKSCLEEIEEDRAKKEREEKARQKIISILQGSSESSDYVSAEEEKETEVQIFEHEAKLLEKEDEIEVLRYQKEQLERKLEAEKNLEVDELNQQIEDLLQRKKEIETENSSTVGIVIGSLVGVGLIAGLIAGPKLVVLYLNYRYKKELRQHETNVEKSMHDTSEHLLYT
ncbi:Oidioi.mRNA.OKI2018_I69.PAR.g13164.t1.cds [Oikopleura dioica]|uniref:Oidioi.mRNA.OKI2018_I69.PAR.g13164.t1.cds n=1 Tax=Oikopleura dioica TaxID=34765 RepID=A0ABN7S3D9_OIKDI|nr:Oidioi.mRNA.OKI2018_I69.PAR.g13164.t1.cds [Oikopleura dioica]